MNRFYRAAWRRGRLMTWIHAGLKNNDEAVIFSNGERRRGWWQIKTAWWAGERGT